MDRPRLALALVVVGLTWLNLVAASVMAVGGSCGSGGAYEIATPCPTGAWMAPVGILLGVVALGAYALTRPPGSPSLLIFAWPALFLSLGVQFLRAASDETDAWGFWLCGVLFLVMGVAPLLMLFAGDRREWVRVLLGDGRAEPVRDGSDGDFVAPRGARWSRSPSSARPREAPTTTATSPRTSSACPASTVRATCPTPSTPTPSRRSWTAPDVGGGSDGATRPGCG